jgi:hypothetical protein
VLKVGVVLYDYWFVTCMLEYNCFFIGKFACCF